MRPIDRSLLQIFLSEQAEHIGRIRGLLDSLAHSADQTDTAAVDEILRRAHTLKGAAQAVGLEDTQALVHSLETMLSKLRRGELKFSQPLLRLAEQALEAVEDILAAALAENEWSDFKYLQDALNVFPEAAQRQPEKPQPLSAHITPPPDREAASAAVEAAGSAANAGSSDLVRVNADRIDDLVRSSSHLLVTAVAEAESDNLFSRNARYLDEMEEEWTQLRRVHRVYSGDPASELQRANACLNYIDRRLGSLRLRAHQAEAVRYEQTKEIRNRAHDLYENACRIRMTPAETVFVGLGPLIRELAHQENKRIEFRTEGLETQADRVVLQALKDPVLHLLRNSVSHGAESEKVRLAHGKPPATTIRLQMRSRGDRLTLTVEDDGRGIDQAAVLDEAVRRGLLPAVRDPGPVNFTKLLLQGLSTAKEVTNLSGRGLGLSIVQEAVTRLQGDVSIRRVPAGGTAISISVPLTMSSQHVLLVRAGVSLFGISTSYIDRLLRVDVSEVQSIDGRNSIISGSSAIPLVRLSHLLNLPAETAETEKLYIVIVNASDEQFAVVVDALHDERDAIIKETGLPAGNTGLAAGAIPMDDGSVAVVLNVPELFSRGRHLESAAGFLPAEPEKKAASILVVDDSLTTRSLEKSILESQGYRVRVAVDGMQALEQIRAEMPDLVISDVMMPRMTGFELLAEIKADSGTKNIPVILVTSLESREEQARGLELGADAYIVKHRFDQRELMQIVRQIL